MNNDEYLDYLLAESLYGFDPETRSRAKAAHKNLSEHLDPTPKQAVQKLYRAPLNKAQRHRVARDAESRAIARNR